MFQVANSVRTRHAADSRKIALKLPPIVLSYLIRHARENVCFVLQCVVAARKRIKPRVMALAIWRVT